MKLSYPLIKSFLDIELTPEKCAEVLTLLGIEVDGFENGVFEISLTPNLGHCMSALGIARELSAALKKPLKKTAHTLSEIGQKFPVAIENPKFTPRYMARVITNVQIGPSPAWLQKELTDCGLKPISNVVDATNYMLLKWGQPLHAFDFNKIEGKKLSVTCAKGDEKFLGLNGVEVEVPHGTLLICDAKKPVALAGILGAENSAVSETTKNVLLEAAAFDPIAVRIAARKMQLRTDSAQRFEKGVDIAGLGQVLAAAAHLIAELSGGVISDEGADVTSSKLAPKVIDCRIFRANQILGTRLSMGEIKDIFHRLGFATHTAEEETLSVEVPLYRNDISEEIDLIEEIARIYGYNNIEKQAPLCRTSDLDPDPLYTFEKEVKQRLSALRLQEFLTCDLISPALGKIAKEQIASHITFLHTLHSKSEEYSVLRPSLLPGLLQVTQGNLAQKNLNLRAFETGRIHFAQNNQIVELPMAAILLTGKAAPAHFSQKDRDIDFFDLKGILESLCHALKLPNVRFTSSNHISLHPSRQANLEVDGLIVGSLGEVHPNLTEPFGIKQKVYFAEAQLPALLKMRTAQTRMKPLPQFPSSERDWTLPLALDVEIGTVLSQIQNQSPALLEKVELVDLYQPEEANQKNATLRFTYRGKEKTASFEEVEAAHAQIVQSVSV